MNKIILALIFATGSLFAQTGASFKFSDVGSWWIPKFKPFGNSTAFTDSTNYVTLNKGFYAFDSIKTDKDLIVNGAVVLDTNRLGKLYYVGKQLYLVNGKTNNADIVNIIGFGGSSYYWDKSRSLGVDTRLMTLDTINGLTLGGYNVQTSSTGQIKLPSDTASDYDANDAITLNRQSGKITTKSLTTASDGFYTLTFTNSLISATTKIFLNWTGGTESAGRPTIYKATCGSGSATIILLNLSGAGSFNGTVQLDYVIFN